MSNDIELASRGCFSALTNEKREALVSEMTPGVEHSRRAGALAPEGGKLERARGRNNAYDLDVRPYRCGGLFRSTAQRAGLASMSPFQQRSPRSVRGVGIRSFHFIRPHTTRKKRRCLMHRGLRRTTEKGRLSLHANRKRSLTNARSPAATPLLSLPLSRRRRATEPPPREQPAQIETPFGL